MKRLSFLLLLLASSAWAQAPSTTPLARFDGFIAPAGGVPPANVAVCSSGGSGGPPCSPLTLIYTDSSGTAQQANPFSAFANGRYTFFAPAGTYAVQTYGTGYSTTLTTVTLTSPGGAGGGVSPSNLTTFFTKYMGFSPQDCGNSTCTTTTGGAKGDGRIAFDGASTISVARVSSASLPGGCTAADAGKVVEFGTFLTNVTAANPCFNSTTWNVQATAPATTTNQSIYIVSDDTAPMDTWVAAINAVGSAHSGYLPKGMYYFRHPLRFVGPAGSDCGPPSNAYTSYLSCSLWLQGVGFGSSILTPASEPNFSWTTGNATDNGVLYVSNWTGGTISGIGISASINNPYTNVTLPTTSAAGLYICSNSCTGSSGQVSHFWISNLWVQNMQETSGPEMTGIWSSGDFENYYTFLATEANHINLRTASLNKVVYDSVFFESSRTNANVLFTNTQYTHLRFRNCHFTAGAQYEIYMGQSTFTDPLVIDESRFDAEANPSFGVYIPNGTTGNINISNTEMVQPSSNASSTLISNLSAAELFLDQVLLSATGSSNAINHTGTGHIHMMNSPTIVGGIVGATAANVFQANATNTGWGGNGDWSATRYLTATNCQLGGASGTTSPAACGSSTAGMIAIPASQTTYTVNTTQVTTNSEIRIQQMTDNSGLPSSPTCNSGAITPVQSARVAGTSFTFTLTSVASVTCVTWQLVN